MMSSPSDRLFRADNPLINPVSLPFGVPPLNELKDEQFLPAISWSIAKSQEDIKAISTNPASPSFANTIEALEFAQAPFLRVANVFGSICASKTNEELQKIEEVVSVEQSKFISEIFMNADLFRKIESLYDNQAHLSLTAEQSRLLSETYKGFVRSGALLPKKDQERLKEINERLSEITTQFQNNETKSRAAYRYVVNDKNELEGIPERALNNFRAQAQNEGLPLGSYLLLLDPFPFDVLVYARDRELRKKIYKAGRLTCYGDEFDNRTNIIEILKLRFEKAKLLGYDSHAALVLSDRMAGDVKTVQKFLEENLSIYKTAAQRELQEIRSYAVAKDGIADFKPWDLAYYQNLVREERFSFKPELLRPYFDLEKVLQGVRQHAEKLFEIEFREEKTGKYPVYHPDVRTYEVFDNKTGEILGLFYADYFARPGSKRSGAWMSALRDRGMVDGEDSVPIITNNCNFDSPTPEQPSLLSIDEVKTIFHELGHALHALLSRGRYASLNGTNVKRDFVELPSQVMENWVVEPEVLTGFARHYQTGETIPRDYLAKIKASELFCVGLFGLRQTFFALLDMAFHTMDPSLLNNIETIEEAVTKTAVLLPPEFGLMSTAFTHIFSGGYDAGYYGYKWAEVLDADVFARFKEKGLYNADLGQRLRAAIFSTGNTAEPMELYKKMMGRAPDPDAMFRREGLLKGAQN